jgi:hypothetical protein
MTSANSYMFQHWDGILRDSRTKVTWYCIALTGMIKIKNFKIHAVYQHKITLL